MNNIPFNPLHHPNIKDGYMISPYGDIKFKDVDESYKPSYHSSNGYDYAIFITNENKTQLFPIDEIIGTVYIPIPNELQNKRITIKHIDGDTRNISLDNLQWIEDIEIWKVVTYPGVKPNTYEVSNHGRVRKTDKIYSTRSVNSRGYTTLSLLNSTGTPISVTVHRLTAWEFCEDKTGKRVEVNHIDGNKRNNHYKNLEWGSHKTNMLHAFYMDMIDRPKGSENHASTLSEQDVIFICNEFKRQWGNSMHVYKSAKNKGICVTLKQIQHIKHKESWSWLSDKYWTKADLDKLHIDKIHLICKTLVKFNNNTNESLEYLKNYIPMINKRFIELIKYKEQYKDISDKYF